jgi:hypothetical protein
MHGKTIDADDDPPSLSIVFKHPPTEQRRLADVTYPLFRTMIHDHLRASKSDPGSLILPYKFYVVEVLF